MKITLCNFSETDHDVSLDNDNDSDDMIAFNIDGLDNEFMVSLVDLQAACLAFQGNLDLDVARNKRTSS